MRRIKFPRNPAVPSFTRRTLPTPCVFISHSMAINPRIIIILAKFPPINGQDRFGTLDGQMTNYSDRFVLPVFVTTNLCNNAGSTFEAGWEIYKYQTPIYSCTLVLHVSNGLVLDSSINTSGAGSTHICLWIKHERIRVLTTVVLEVPHLDYHNLDTRRSYTSILVPSIYKYLCTSVHVIYFASTSAIATTVGHRKWTH